MTAKYDGLPSTLFLLSKTTVFH